MVASSIVSLSLRRAIDGEPKCQYLSLPPSHAYKARKVSMTKGTPANEVIMILELSSIRWKGSKPCDIVIVHLLGENRG